MSPLQQKDEALHEYILFIFQAEEQLRSHNFEVARVEELLLLPLQLEAAEHIEVVSWLNALAMAMEAENVKTTGHVQEGHLLIQELQRLNLHLIRNDASYRGMYQNATQHLIRMGGGTRPIETCLHHMHAVRKNGHKGTEQEKEAFYAFADVMAYLSHKHFKRNRQNA